MSFLKRILFFIPDILKNHVMDLTFCASAVADDEAKVSAFNMLGEKMIFERSTDDDKTTNEIRSEMESKSGAPILINEKARIVERDLMGTNGVVHIIDTVLETQSGLPISTMLGSRNLTTFKRLMEYGSFDDDYDNLDNATYFIPSDDAFESSELGKFWVKQLEEAPQKLKNNEKLKRFLDYHVVQPLTKSCELSEKMLPTIMKEPLRVNLYSTMPTFSNVMNRATVNCARLIHFDQDSCGSVLHEVDKVLTPPTGSLMEMLQNNPQYSQFLKLVTKANLTSLMEESNLDGVTLFVPRDEVFSEVEDWIKEKNSAELEELIKNHIVPDVMCCAGIVRSEWPFTRSIEAISKNQLTLTRDRRPKVQNAGVTKCDQVGTNGIIHEINDVINIAPRRQPPPVDQNNNFYNTFFNRPFFFK